MAQLCSQVIKIYILEQVIDSFGAHLRNELVGIVVFEILVAGRQIVYDGKILVFGQQVKALYVYGVSVAIAHVLAGYDYLMTRIDDDVLLVIYYLVQLLGR